MKTLVFSILILAVAVLLAQPPVQVPSDFPAASHPDFLLNQRTDDKLAARFPWVPQPLYFGGPESIGPLDPDWVWPDYALVDWNRDGLLDVVCGMSAGTYNHRPKEQRFRTLVYLNTGKRQDGVPIFAEPKQVPLDYPVGAMFFDDIDGDGALDLIVQNGKIFRWYRDDSTAGERHFVFQSNLEDYGLQVDLGLLETLSMSPSIQLIDWDGDGVKDLVIGGRGGNLNYYPRKEVGFGKGFAKDGAWLGGDRNGSVVVHKGMGKRNGKLVFTTGQRLTAGDDERAISYYDTATAVITDWNDDGKLDVVVASFDNLFVFLNTGRGLAAGRRVPVAGNARLPWERVQIMEANWSASDRLNLLLAGSSFPWYLPNTGRKGAPEYARIKTLLQKHPPLSAGDFAVPTVGDLDADGKLDLVIGNEDGYLLFARNLGDGFAPLRELQAGGKIFRLETRKALQGPAEGRWGYTSPVLVDWDNDGDLDLIVGSSLEHFLYLENKGGGTFAAPVPLAVNGKQIKTVWRTRPVAQDLDGDGEKDLLALDGEGLLTLYHRHAAPEQIRDKSGQPIKLDGAGRETGRTTLTLMDWDGDGKLDLIAGNAIENFDGLRWYKNVGTKTKWILDRQPNISLNLPWNHYHLLEPVDWNHDGKLDLLAGSEGGWVYLYLQKQ